MTLLADDVAERSEEPEVREDMETLRELLVQCRERVLALAAPASADARAGPLQRPQVLEQWRCGRPSTCTATTMRRCGCHWTRAWATC
jgi:two-component system sensor histidine kinase RegB